jgi:hypothetical protein
MNKLYLVGAAALFGLCACTTHDKETTTYVPEPQPARVIVQAPPPAPVVVAPATESTSTAVSARSVNENGPMDDGANGSSSYNSYSKDVTTTEHPAVIEAPPPAVTSDTTTYRSESVTTNP